MFSRVMLLLVFGNIGCIEMSGWHPSDSRDYEYRIRSGFSLEQEAQIHAGILDWETDLNHIINFSQSHDDFDQIGKIDFKLASIVDLPRADNPQNTTVGNCSFDGIDSTIQISNNLDTNLFNWVIRHEIGHALGLKHSQNDTLMCAISNCASSMITSFDIEQFYSVWKVEEK